MNQHSPHIKGALLLVTVTAALGAIIVYYGWKAFARDAERLQNFSVALTRIARPFPAPRAKEPIKIASLEFSPREGEYMLGEIGETTIQMRAENTRIAGVDIRIHYDPSAFEIIDVVPILSDVTIGVKDIDPVSGSIFVSALAPPGASWEEMLDLVNIRWKSLTSGEYSMILDFIPGSTTDTNIAEFGSGDDVITSVVNATYTIFEE